MTAPEIDLLGDPLDPHAADPDAQRGRFPEQMAQIMGYCLDELRAGLPRAAPAELRAVALACTLRLCREMGGTRYYWPRGESFERAARDMGIYAEHDGTVDGPHGVRALARKHGLTDNRVWQILSDQLALHRARVQPELPGLTEGDRRG